ncbi:MAG: asparagine synthase (glutamine-hydrolyzing) [Chloroflexi bacterium]|nr:MAG: asparagine synthase (glutamine-hydrolyzing) [Chloroflexota bacterium]
MCGICGLAVRSGPAPDLQLLTRMCDTLVHRGPDDQGILLRDGVGLGVRRLAIIDPVGGHQPIHNEGKTTWIVFNGEIYNFPELRERLQDTGHRFYTHTDTEVIVHAYDEWGEGCVERLNGVFAFAIWDSRRGRLFLARDRLGVKPLYYALTPERLAFASELKALLSIPGLRRAVDLAALDDYLALEYVPSPRCIIAGIQKLPPGHTLTWDQVGGVACPRRYWDVDLTAGEQQPDRTPVAQHAEELRSVLLECVRKELIADVPLGVFLSGGIDSSTVTAMMTRLLPGKVHSFSIGFTDRSFDESGYAREVAAHLGTNHHEMIFETSMLTDLVPTVTQMMDEPLADASIVPTYLLSRFARESVTVALGGDGGDELFAGYPTLLAHRLAAYYQRMPAVMRDRLVPALVGRLPVSMDNISLDFKLKRFVDGAGYSVGERHARWLGSFTREQRAELLSPEVKAALDDSQPTDLVAEHLARHRFVDPLNSVLYLDMKMYLENDILVKLDRASMMASLEARVPLLNVDLVEHVARLPISLKLRGRESKFLLKRALHDVLPDRILGRGKKGFGMPVAKWLRGPLREMALAALSPEKIEREGFFQPAYVQRLLEEHLSGRKDNRKPLWTLLVFERWYDTYVAASPPVARPAFAVDRP